MKRKMTKALVLIVVVAMVAGAYAWGRSQAKATTSTPAGMNVHLTDYSDNDGTESTVVLSGAIGDFGTATRSGDQGAVMTLHLQRGTIQLDTTSLAKRFTTAVGKAVFSQTTCSGSVQVTSSVPILASSGTGAYKRASGKFSLSMNLDEVVPKQLNCSANNKMLGQAIVSSGWGKVSL